MWLNTSVCKWADFHCCVCLSLSGPLYGSLLRAWQCFFLSTERLSALHTSVSQTLVSEDGERIHSWQKETFPRKMFCGFRESHDLATAFSRAQKPWEKRLKKVIVKCMLSLINCVNQLNCFHSHCFKIHATYQCIQARSNHWSVVRLMERKHPK